ncbi:immunoglobulin domain-containing protein, partial [Candidatus Woesearchaeota archaeon]|nr:immunoglobulin domain-containing protein [Candidatus Woesearchaeota archaeon]
MAAKKTLMGLILIMVLLAALSLAEVKTFKVKEMDLVKIIPEATDLDQDAVTYYYSFPLNEKGEWQTAYGDAGEYYLNITASDGKSEEVQRIKLIVDKVNRAPIIVEKKLVIKETQTIDLKNIIKDPDGDPLVYSFNPPFDQSGIWKTKFGDAQTFLTNFVVSDGAATINGRVEIEVQSTNQPPQITGSFSEDKIISLKEGETLEFYVEAEDPEEGKLTYSWSLDGTAVETGAQGKINFDFNSSGEHILAVTIDDGVVPISKDWKIVVEDVKRIPEFGALLP